MARSVVKVMLDTTFVIDHQRRVPAAVERMHEMLECGDEPIITSVVVSEARVSAREPGDPSLLRATVLTRNVRDFELTPVRLETY